MNSILIILLSCLYMTSCRFSFAFSQLKSLNNHKTNVLLNKQRSEGYQVVSPLLAGGGGFGGGGGSSSKAKQKGNKKSDSSSSKSTISAKKKLQIQEKLIKSYGGDVAKGTEQRIQKAMSSLPPHIQEVAALYKKINQWDASMASLSLMQQSQLPQHDIDGAKRAREELKIYYEKYNLNDQYMHNLFQQMTWDASADAKAAKAIIGQMPQHIEERVNKACDIIAECVKRAGRKEGRCLDVGCGHGTLIPSFINAGIYPGQIKGVDLSPEMIRNAEERYRGPEFIATDFLQLVEDDQYDGVMFCSSLHDLPDMKSSLFKAAKLLRSGGKLVIIHAQGGAHVDSQHKANPLLVRRGLPSGDELIQWAEEMLLEVEVLPAAPSSKQDKEEGYLAVLRKKS